MDIEFRIAVRSGPLPIRQNARSSVCPGRYPPSTGNEPPSAQSERINVKADHGVNWL
jgi:hypothetical protein